MGLFQEQTVGSRIRSQTSPRITASVKTEKFTSTVQETDTAWQAGRVHAPTWNLIKPTGSGTYINPNLYTIGIEHEGDDQSDWTVEMYNTSSDLLADICKRWNIPVDRSHIIGHREIYSLKTCPGAKVELNKLVDMARQKSGYVDPSSIVTESGTVTTTAILNLRRGSPSRCAPLARTVGANTQLSYIAYTEKGETVNKISRWYQTQDGFWFWGGGVNSDNLQQWMVDLKLGEIWTIATGRGVGVAVVDTGIEMLNGDLSYDGGKFFLYDSKASLQDANGHGTHCAGLIGARNKRNNKIGAAPECNLYVCKISEGDSIKQAEAIRYANAINWCASIPEIKIISISWTTALDDKVIMKQIQDAINNAVVTNNKIIVCARGNVDYDGDSSEYYPACFDNTIRIGLIPDGQNYFNYTTKVSYVTDGIDIKSYQPGKNDLLKKSGTSMANAIAAGIIALIAQKLGPNCSLQAVVAALDKVTTIENYNNRIFRTLKGDLLYEYFNS